MNNLILRHIEEFEIQYSTNLQPILKNNLVKDKKRLEYLNQYKRLSMERTIFERTLALLSASWEKKTKFPIFYIKSNSWEPLSTRHGRPEYNSKGLRGWALTKVKDFIDRDIPIEILKELPDNVGDLKILYPEKKSDPYLVIPTFSMIREKARIYWDINLYNLYLPIYRWDD